MATRERDVEDGWGGEETPEAPPVFEGRTLRGRQITLTLSAPPLALPGDEERSTGSRPPPAIEPRTYDGWNADRLRRSSLPPSTRATSITPLPSRAEHALHDAHAGDDAFALVSRPTGSLPALDLESEMAERFSLGDFSGSLRAAELLLGQDSRHAVAQHYARETQAKLESHYRSRLEGQGRIPRLLVAEDEVRWLGLDPQVGHMLARIDGLSDYDQVVKASGMPKLAALRTLVELVDGRVVRLM
jgi:hypothetical protein